MPGYRSGGPRLPSSCAQNENSAFLRAPKPQRPSGPRAPGRTFRKNARLQPLPRSPPAADSRAASEAGAGPGALLGPASRGPARGAAAWRPPPSPGPRAAPKGSGHLSSGLEPSSLVLAPQRIRAREMDRGFVGFLLPERPCGSILREDAELFLSWSLARGRRAVTALGLAATARVPGARRECISHVPCY